MLSDLPQITCEERAGTRSNLSLCFLYSAQVKKFVLGQEKSIGPEQRKLYEELIRGRGRAMGKVSMSPGTD